MNFVRIKPKKGDELMAWHPSTQSLTHGKTYRVEKFEANSFGKNFATVLDDSGTKGNFHEFNFDIYNARELPGPRTLIIENDPVDLVPEEVINIIEKQLPGPREFWGNFRHAYDPENKAASLARLLSLNTEDNIIMRHVFTAWDQLESMVLVLEQLMKLKKRINLFMVRCNLEYELVRYMRDLGAEFGQWPKGGAKAKRLLKVLEFHHIRTCHDSGLDQDWLQESCTRVNTTSLDAYVEKEAKNCRHGYVITKGNKRSCGYCGTPLPEEK